MASGMQFVTEIILLVRGNPVKLTGSSSSITLNVNSKFCPHVHPLKVNWLHGFAQAEIKSSDSKLTEKF